MSRPRQRPSRESMQRATLHDLRQEPTGTFAGILKPEAPVGTYGNIRRFRRQGAGTFAGDADRQRQGSFADRAA